eukprot:7377011-Prymnesium_polylepis.1
MPPSLLLRSHDNLRIENHCPFGIACFPRKRTSPICQEGSRCRKVIGRGRLMQHCMCNGAAVTERADAAASLKRKYTDLVHREIAWHIAHRAIYH